MFLNLTSSNTAALFTFSRAMSHTLRIPRAKALRAGSSITSGLWMYKQVNTVCAREWPSNHVIWKQTCTHWFCCGITHALTQQEVPHFPVLDNSWMGAFGKLRNVRYARHWFVCFFYHIFLKFELNEMPAPFHIFIYSSILIYWERFISEANLYKGISSNMYF